MAIVRSLTWIKKGKSSRIVEAAHILEREIVDAFFSLPTRVPAINEASRGEERNKRSRLIYRLPLSYPAF